MKPIIVTEKKLRDLGACSEGLRAFRRVAKGKKRVYLTPQLLEQYSRRGGRFVLWLAQAFKMSGVFTTRRGDARVWLQNGETKAKRLLGDGSGWLYDSEGNYFAFSPYGPRAWDHPARTHRGPMPESFDEALKIADGALGTP